MDARGFSQGRYSPGVNVVVVVVVVLVGRWVDLAVGLVVHLAVVLSPLR